MNTFNRIMAQLSGVIALILWTQGHAWIDNGYGLHPMLAGMGVILAILLPHVFRGSDW